MKKLSRSLNGNSTLLQKNVLDLEHLTKSCRSF